MTTHTIAVLGGSGFVGSHLCARLARDGHNLRVLTRNYERHRDLLVLPNLDIIALDPHEPAALTRSLAGCDVVINLVGILNERGHDGSGFRRAHVEFPRKVIEACRANGIARLLHMSALGADTFNGPSHYQRTKGEGEQLVLDSGLHVTTFRPSVIFGPGDSFLRRFAKLLRRTPLLFPLAVPEARFATVYVLDVVEAYARAIDNSATHGQSYELCGPHEYTLLELVRYVAHTIHSPHLIIPLPDWASRLQAELFEYIPGKPFSRDNYLSAQVPNVCACPFPELFGFKPRALEEIAPAYLGHHTMRDRYNQLRIHH
ncbi:MAG TPA: complex I NDUFA9 subunit family protein [Gammaproteobacteria bacterium]